MATLVVRSALLVSLGLAAPVTVVAPVTVTGPIEDVSWRLYQGEPCDGDELVVVPANVPSVDTAPYSPDWVLIGLVAGFVILDVLLYIFRKGTISERFRAHGRKKWVPWVFAGAMVVLWGHLFKGWFWRKAPEPDPAEAAP